MQPHSWLLVSSLLSAATLVLSAESWDYLSVVPPQNEPFTAQKAEQMGYVRQEPRYCGTNLTASESTKVTPGYRYQNGNGWQLLFDADGQLAGVQISMPAGAMGINGDNETIRLPPRGLDGFLFEKDRHYLAVYFKDPRLVCQGGSGQGSQLFLYNGELSPIEIPLEEHQLSIDWRKGRGRCVVGMGTHYFRSLLPQQQCEDIYPLFLMYDTAGKLGAFGFMFQGTFNYTYGQWFKLNSTQLRRESKHSVVDAAQLPACTAHKDFAVVGLHVYLRPQEQLQCRSLVTRSSAMRDSPRISLTVVLLFCSIMTVIHPVTHPRL